MKRRVFATAVLCLLFSTAVFAQKTEIDFDRNANFANYHTYMWEKSPNPAKGEWNQRILDAIDKQLQAKGLQKVESNPDMWVIYSNSVKDEKQVVGVGYGLSPTWGWNNGTGPAFHNTFVSKVGTLVVEMADANGKQALWRGSVSDTIDDNTNKNIKNLDKAVSKLFKNFPPKQKK